MRAAGLVFIYDSLVTLRLRVRTFNIQNSSLLHYKLTVINFFHIHHTLRQFFHTPFLLNIFTYHQVNTTYHHLLLKVFNRRRPSTGSKAAFPSHSALKYLAPAPFSPISFHR